MMSKVLEERILRLVKAARNSNLMIDNLMFDSL